jgi:hypothetical protein
MAAFEAMGVPVARIPSEIPGLIAGALGRRRSHGTRVTPGRAKKKIAGPARQPERKARPAGGRGKAAARPARKPGPSGAKKPSARKVSRSRRPR